jgi:hypothetical protein
MLSYTPSFLLRSLVMQRDSLVNNLLTDFGGDARPEQLHAKWAKNFQGAMCNSSILSMLFAGFVKDRT